MIQCQRFRIWAALIVVCAAFGLTSCGYRSEDYRFRMTVEVETPEGMRTGSSVIQVDITEPGKGPLKLPNAGGTRRITGEAAAVDLPDGRVLFALLETPGEIGAVGSFPADTFKPELQTVEYPFIQRAKDLKNVRGAGILPRESYPFFVTFRDLSDPTSMERIDPDDLAKTFGKGVSLRRITIEMTDDRLSTDIFDRLRWLRDFDGKSYTSSDFPNGLPLGDFVGLFVRG